MPAPSILAHSMPGLADPRRLLSSIGEVVYGWEIASDTLSWGPNVSEVLAGVRPEALERGLAFAGLVEPGSGRSRYDAIFLGGGHDEGDGVSYRTRYAAALADRTMWVEDTGRWFAGSDGKPATARGVLRLERAVRPEELAASGNEACDRVFLIGRLDEVLSENLPVDRSVVCLIVAIDELTRLNDDFGHDATDAIIAEVQVRLRSVMRRRDQLLRYSGNRFAILLSGCPAGELEAAARRFSKAVAASAIETAQGITLVRLRMGAALAPDLFSQASQLVAAAEDALVSAKTNGNDNLIVAKRQQVRRAADSAAALDIQAVAALNDRRVRLALQPIVDATTRRTVFHEALLRVGQADGLYFSSAELVPLLERRGLVRLFDHRVLELATEMLAGDPALALSINVSAQSLADPEWIDTLLACTRQTALARRLVVEVTETATIDDPTRVAALLERIKQQGCRIAIDDFGAGHTSLKHLRAFPIDILKLDGAFTQNLRRSTDDRFYVRTLIDLARHLTVETVAEWVDDDTQASMLRDWGITYLQGHLVGKAQIRTADEGPVPASAVA